MKRDSEWFVIAGFIAGHNLENIADVVEEDFSDTKTANAFRVIKELYITGNLFSEGIVNVNEIRNRTGLKPSEFMSSRLIEPHEHRPLIEELVRDGAIRAAHAFSQGKLTQDQFLDNAGRYGRMHQDRKAGISLADYILNDFEEDQRNKLTAKRILFQLGPLDKITGGMCGGQLITVAARPGSGKSAFALLTALNAAQQGKRVLFFSLEMGRSEIGQRTLQIKSNVPNDAIKGGNMDRWQWGNASEMIDRCKLENLEVIDSMYSISEMRRYIELQCPDYVIVDQLSLIVPEVKVKDTREKYVNHTKALKRIAMKAGIPVMELAQVGRGSEGGLPSLNHLKESGSIEEDSDIVIFLHPFKDLDEAEAAGISMDCFPGHRPYGLKVAKNRNGAIGITGIKFNPKRVLFYA